MTLKMSRLDSVLFALSTAAMVLGVCSLKTVHHSANWSFRVDYTQAQTDGLIVFDLIMFCFKNGFRIPTYLKFFLSKNIFYFFVFMKINPTL